jgi:DNA/RNA-binding domain of Phe-tRNA-synthetase-like protein
MLSPPFPVSLSLGGWTLLWARLELGGGPPAAADGLGDLRRRVAARARARRELARLPADATVAAVRSLFHAAGCDPTRYRPSSEALLRRVLKGEELPAIQPLVDVINCLSTELAVPCCAAAEGSFGSPVTLRAGLPGEAFESLRGPFHLEGKPLLADGAGAFSTPITDSRRVKILDDTRRAWLVAYLPAAVLSLAAALDALEALLRELRELRDPPAVRVDLAAASPGDGAA